nr:aminotransferase class I/II-fold pyridoxal phosphate-dependent enzyme [uncultured Flavobacterium sp.]
MNSNRIPLSSPHMGGSEQKYITETLASNWVTSLGPNLTDFEDRLEAYLGAGAVTALNSGTSAIHLGLILLGVQAGDEVLCQTMTFSASANPILYQGATPIFIDSEPDTWNLCPVALEEAIQDRIAKGVTPKAIIAVHLYGVPYQVAAIREVADRYGIPILEDAAEALGSSYKGQRCGTFGDIGVFSFNGNKIITSSSGGALVLRTAALKKKAIFYATQSKDDAPHYQHSTIGYNYRMSNVCAAIGLGQLEVLDERLRLRSAMHDFYVDLFKSVPGVTVYTVPHADYASNYWLTTLLIRPELTGGITREIVRQALNDAAIDCRPLWKPMHLQPLFENQPYYGGTVAANLFDIGLCMPSGSALTDADRSRIKAVLMGVF